MHREEGEVFVSVYVCMHSVWDSEGREILMIGKRAPIHTDRHTHLVQLLRELQV